MDSIDINPPGLYRRIVLDYIIGMAVFWTPAYPKNSTRQAISRFGDLRADCDGLPDPFVFQLVSKRKVEKLPLLQDPPGLTTDVLFYGALGNIGQVICWGLDGVQKIPLDFFEHPSDVNNINGLHIGTDRLHMYRRRSKKN